ncbi:MAG: hypothetical protein II951_11510 [Bacteroidales bacterium]|jgi:hypothetical protein|nr:hypothetical protein [Bacteroidales bacterium]
METKNKILTFWLLTIGGFLAHTATDALPAFWGESIAAMQPPASTGMIAFMMLMTYFIPAVGILLVIYGNGRPARITNAVLACVMALFTVLHMAELLECFNPAQLLIMPLMAVIAVLMSVESFKLLKK